MSRTRPGLTGSLAAVVLFSGAAAGWGHGGTFRPPGGGKPPPTSGPMAPTVISGGMDWQTWWDLNRTGLLPGKDEAFKRRVRTPGDGAEKPEDGGKVEDPAKVWAEARARAAKDQVVPFLLKVLEGHEKNRDELIGASLIALAKIAPADVAFPILVKYLGDRRSAVVVRESAALGMGLLRRSQPSLQMGGAEADRTRQRLFDAFDDKDEPDSARTFAALALGLLADQPYGGADTKDGAAVVQGLWERIGKAYAAADLPAALFAALALQPQAGMTDEVRKGLASIVEGRAAFGRSWDPVERSNAMTAALRGAGADANALLLRSLKRSNEALEVRRAAYMALGRRAEAMETKDREEATGVVLVALKQRSDALGTGLGLLALGRLLAADWRHGGPEPKQAAVVNRLLLSEAEEGSTVERGFAVLGLSLSASAAAAAAPALPYPVAARKVVLEGLLHAKGPDQERAAYAAGSGILRMDEAVDPLREIVLDHGSDPVLRGHAAVALGEIGRDDAKVLASLLSLLSEERGITLRLQAAMALCFLGRTLAQTKLLDELKTANSEFHRAHVVIALGILGDLHAVPDLLAFASDENVPDLPRALAVAALGMLTDPEPRPSMHLITDDANFPAATGTPALFSAFSIF